MTTIKDLMQGLGQQARLASRAMAAADTNAKNQALLATATALKTHAAALLQANAKDMAAGRTNALEPAMLDRLELTPKRIDDMIEGLQQVAALADPIGEITDMHEPFDEQILYFHEESELCHPDNHPVKSIPHVAFHVFGLHDAHRHPFRFHCKALTIR